MTIGRRFADFDRIASSIFVLEVDGRGRPLYAAVNTHALDEAARPLTDFIGRSALDVYPQAYGRAVYAHQCEVIETATAQSFEVSLPVADQLRTVLVTLTPETDATGKVVRLFASHQDRTPERNARTARAEFDTLSSEMESFVAFAAHDLRAPMRNITMLADLLRQELQDQPPETLELLDLIDTVATKSMDLIAEVLDQAQSAQVSRQETVFSFPVICHDICTTLDPHRHHQVDTSLCSLKAERNAVQIALRNLLENAIKHGGRNRLSIEIIAQNGMPGLLDITLIDNGRGFDQPALDAMNRSEIKAEQGYGLFAVKQLIAARGGMIHARNLPGAAGTAVRFSLPGKIIGADPITEEMPQFAVPYPPEGPRYSA